MPQASLATYELYKSFFGPNAMDGEAIEYLSQFGIMSRLGFDDAKLEEHWDDPKVRAAARYLHEEWDY